MLWDNVVDNDQNLQHRSGQICLSKQLKVRACLIISSVVSTKMSTLQIMLFTLYQKHIHCDHCSNFCIMYLFKWFWCDDITACKYQDQDVYPGQKVTLRFKFKFVPLEGLQAAVIHFKPHTKMSPPCGGRFKV